MGATLLAGMSAGVYLHVYGGPTLDLLVSGNRWTVYLDLRNAGLMLVGGLILRFLWSRTSAEWRLRVELTRGGLIPWNASSPPSSGEEPGPSPTLRERLLAMAERVASARSPSSRTGEG